MAKRSILGVFAVLLLLFAAFVSGQAATQGRSSEGNSSGRYQLDDGPVTKVFDTHTGKLYVWLPRDEKAGKDPYIFVQDPVNATGTHVEITWNTKLAGK